MLGHGELEDTVLQPLHGDPEQRRFEDVEGRPAVLLEDAQDLLVLVRGPAQVRELDRGRQLAVDQLQRLAVAGDVEAGPQCGVTGHHLGHGLPEGGLVEFGGDPEAVDVVVAVGAAGHLHVEDHALLHGDHRVGVHHARRQLLPVLGSHQGERFPLCLPAGHRPGERCQRGDGRGVEDVPQRDRPALLVQSAGQLDGADRVAAEVEEVVVDADLGHPQHLRPHGGEGPLDRRPGATPPLGATGRPGAGSAARSTLPLTVSGSSASTVTLAGIM